MRGRGAWLCFADEAGRSLRPPKVRTWSRRGHPPRVKVTGKGGGRVSLAALVCARSGRRTRLIHRMLVHHPGRSREKKGFRERDFAAVLDAVHQQLGGPVVLVWDNSPHHVDARMRELLARREKWLTVFRFPAYASELNPAEGVWANLRNSLGNLTACTTDELAALVRTRLKKMQYRPGLLDGFIAETGLTLQPP
ncbi:transposase [Streptomyces sp. Sce081]|uniref:transposase n=1 Tax=Streptomyces sp. Sce081 TaxID=3349853 RepID=UPI0035F2DC1C